MKNIKKVRISNMKTREELEEENTFLTKKLSMMERLMEQYTETVREINRRMIARRSGTGAGHCSDSDGGGAGHCSSGSKSYESSNLGGHCSTTTTGTGHCSG